MPPLPAPARARQVHEELESAGAWALGSMRSVPRSGRNVVGEAQWARSRRRASNRWHCSCPTYIEQIVSRSPPRTSARRADPLAYPPRPPVSSHSHLCGMTSWFPSLGGFSLFGLFHSISAEHLTARVLKALRFQVFHCSLCFNYLKIVLNIVKQRCTTFDHSLRGLFGRDLAEVQDFYAPSPSF
jgi:hypothetical protein